MVVAAKTCLLNVRSSAMFRLKRKLAIGGMLLAALAFGGFSADTAVARDGHRYYGGGHHGHRYYGGHHGRFYAPRHYSYYRPHHYSYYRPYRYYRPNYSGGYWYTYPRPLYYYSPYYSYDYYGW